MCINLLSLPRPLKTRLEDALYKHAMRFLQTKYNYIKFVNLNLDKFYNWHSELDTLKMSYYYNLLEIPLYF